MPNKNGPNKFIQYFITLRFKVFQLKLNWYIFYFNKKRNPLLNNLSSYNSKYCIVRAPHKILNVWVTGETVWQYFCCNVLSLAKAANSIMTHHFVTAGSLSGWCQPIHLIFSVYSHLSQIFENCLLDSLAYLQTLWPQIFFL